MHSTTLVGKSVTDFQISIQIFKEDYLGVRLCISEISDPCGTCIHRFILVAQTTSRMHSYSIIILIMVVAGSVSSYPDFKKMRGEIRRGSIILGKRESPPEELRAPAQSNHHISQPFDYWVDLPTVRVLDDDNYRFLAPDVDTDVMERVAKSGIRPKLALSSRLWGRRR
ncbi:unnamed protein product [Caenorhabditis bovis]|uniref:Uncharacterized protein n=1 Tax=Caenorhabditis bovis TaxID=2654633 RepID=A0A8S1EQJ6_9PELO|nr:unnamed protein product [Caenorhabditis bovis]